MGENWKLMLYAIAGLSDGSPDWGLGVALTWLPDFAAFENRIAGLD